MATYQIMSGIQLPRVSANRIIRTSVGVVFNNSGLNESEGGKKVIESKEAFSAIMAIKKSPSKNETAFSSYDFFRNAVTRSAENTIITGKSLSVDYSKAIEDAHKILDKDRFAARFAEYYNNTDWNDAKSVAQYYKKTSRLFEEQTKARKDEAEFAGNYTQTAQSTLTVLYYTRNSSAFKREIEGIEKIILKSRDAKKVGEHLFGQILTGQIDVNKVLNDGTFAGVKLSAEDISAFKALQTYARSASIVIESQNELLNKIGYNSKVASCDLNNIKHINNRIREFGSALDGSAPLPKNAKWSSLNAKNLRKVLSHGSFSLDQKQAIYEMIKLREHGDMLNKARMAKGRTRKMALSLGQRATGGDNDAVNGIATIDEYLRNIKTGIRIGKVSAKIAVKMAKMSLTAARAAGSLIYYTSLNAEAVLKLRFPKYVQFKYKALQLPIRLSSKIQSSKIYQSGANAVNTVANGISQATSYCANTVSQAKSGFKNGTDLLKNAIEQRRNARAAKKLARFQAKSPKAQSRILKRQAKAAKRKAAAVSRQNAKIAKAAEKKAIKAAGNAGKKGILKALIAACPVVLLVFLIIIIISFVINSFLSLLTMNDSLYDEAAENSLVYHLGMSLSRINKKDHMLANYSANVDTSYNYYSGIDLKEKKVFRLTDWGDSKKISSKIALYTFTSPGGDNNRKTLPVNEYSTAKLSIAAANIFVNLSDEYFVLSTAEQAFTRYAFLTYYNTNNFNCSYSLVITEESVQQYNYCCLDENEFLYQNKDKIQIVSIGETVNGSNEKNKSADRKIKDSDRIYLIDDIVGYSSRGCYSRTYIDITEALSENSSGRTTFQKAIMGNDGKYSINSVSFNHLSDILKNNDLKKAYSENHTDGNALANTYSTDGYSVTYLLNPYISSVCAVSDSLIISATDKKNKDLSQLKAVVTTCNMNKSGWQGNCSNTAIRKCGGSCSADHNCQGHTVCLGHYTCQVGINGHPYCPGHSCSYSKGDVVYQLIHYIKDDMVNAPMNTQSVNVSESFFSNLHSVSVDKDELIDVKRWYEVTSNITIDYNSLAEQYNFPGWDSDAVELVQNLMELDWYKEYGLPSSVFVGGRLSDYEKEQLLKNVSINKSSEEKGRMAILNAALDSVGLIPYYPNGVAKSPIYENNGFGSFGDPIPEIIENQMVYMNWGLSKTAFLDYLFWQVNGNRSSGLTIDKNNIRTKDYNVLQFNNDVQSGDLIVLKQGNEYTDAGVFISFDEPLRTGVSLDKNRWKEVGFKYVHMGDNWSEVKDLSVLEAYNHGTWYVVRYVY